MDIARGSAFALPILIDMRLLLALLIALTIGRRDTATGARGPAGWIRIASRPPADRGSRPAIRSPGAVWPS